MRIANELTFGANALIQGVGVPDLYADSAAAGGGNGSKAAPFNTLAALTAAMTAGKWAQLTGTFRETLTVPANNNRFTGSAAILGSTVLTPWTSEAANVSGPTSNVAMGGTFAGASVPSTPPTGWTVTATGLTWTLSAVDTSVTGQTGLTFTISNSSGASKNFNLKSPSATVAALTAYRFTGYFAVLSGAVADFNWLMYIHDAGFGTYVQDYPLGLTAALKKFTLPVTTTVGVTGLFVESQLTVPDGTTNLQVKITVFRLEAGGSSTVTLNPAGWYATQASDPGEQVFRTDARLFPVASRDLLAAGKSFYNSGATRLYVGDDPTGQTMEVSTRNYGIEVNGKTGVRIEGLTINKAILYGVYGHGGCTNLALSNLTAANSGTNIAVRDFNGDGSPATVNAGVTITGCASSLALLNGINLGDRTDNARVTSCTSYRDAQSGTGEDFTGGIRYVSDSTSDSPPLNNNRAPSVLISGCTVSYSGKDAGGNVIVSSERGHGIWLDTPGNNSSITGCISHDNAKSGVFLEWGTSTGVSTPCGSSLSYNICHGNETGALLSRRTNGAVVEHNTCWGNYRGLWATGDTVSETGFGFKNNVVRNNIAYAPLFGGPCLEVDLDAANPGGTGTGNTYPNNALGVQGTAFVGWGGATYDTYAAAVTASSSAISASITTDPLLVNPPTDFHLQSGSPCKAPAANDGGNVGALGIAA